MMENLSEQCLRGWAAAAQTVDCQQKKKLTDSMLLNIRLIVVTLYL